MKYYIFKVRTNKPELVPDYFILNNCYIGYMGFDSNVVRSKHETYEDIDFQYLHWASGDVLNHDELRRKFFTSGRLNEEDVKDLMNRYPELKPGNDPDWYEVYYPDVNSSRCILREINYKLKTIE